MKKKKIFIDAGHQTGRGGAYHKEYIENKMTIILKDEILPLISSLPNLEIVPVPDKLDLKQTIAWINERADKDDFAVSLHFNSNRSSYIKGTEAYYSNEREKEIAIVFAEEVAKSLDFKNRGAIHDSFTWVGSLGWLRKLVCDSVLVEVGYITNESDMERYGKKAAAEGIKNALKITLDMRKELPSKEELELKISKLQRIIVSLLQQIIAYYRKLAEKRR